MLFGHIPLLKSLLSSLHFYRFSTNAGVRSQTSSRLSPLQFKIIQARTLNDFVKVYAENREEFTPDMYSFTSRNLLTLIRNEKYDFDPEKFVHFLTDLSNQDMSLLAPKQILNILDIARSLQNRGVSTRDENNTFKKERKSFSKYCEILNQKLIAAPKQEAESYAYILNNAIAFHSYLLIRTVVDTLNNILDNSEKTDFEPEKLSYFVISNIFGSLSRLNYTTVGTRQLRAKLLSLVQKQLDDMKLKELVANIVQLNKIPAGSWSNKELGSLSKILERVYTNVGELDQQSILSLLDMQTNGIYSFKRVIDEILRNMVNEISPDGTCSFSEIVALKLLSKISRNSNIFRLQTESREALLQMLKRVSKDTDPEIITQFRNKIDQMLRNNFFGFKKNEVQRFIDAGAADIELQLTSFYEMSKIGINVTNSLFKFYRGKLNSSRMEIYYFATLLNLKKQGFSNKEIEDEINNSEQLFQKIFDTLESFTQNCRTLILDQHNHSPLIDINEESKYHHLLKLDPFAQGTLNQQYLYVLYGYKFIMPISRFSFIKDMMFKITPELMGKLLRDTRTEQLVKSRIWLLELVQSFLFKPLEDPKILVQICRYLSKVGNLIIIQTLQNRHVLKFWNIIRKLIEILSRESFQQLQNQVGTVFHTIMKQYRSYGSEAEYRRMISYMIKHINIWKKYRLEKKVITEGARLNILNQVPSNATLAFDEQGSNSFNRDFYLLCLKPDSPYEPKEITRYSLRCIFKSTNCAAFIEENFNRIVEVIDETFSIGTLQEYLIHFNHKRGNSLKLYKKVVEKFVEVLKPYFYLDAIGIMRQLSELRFNFTHPGKVLTDSLVDWFTNKADFYSLSTNIQFLRLLTYGQKCELGEYGKKILEKSKENSQPEQKIQLFYQLAMNNYKLESADLQRIDLYSRRSLNLSLYLFCLFENIYKPSFKAQIIQKLINICQKNSDFEDDQDFEDREAIVSKSLYQYFKEQYPTETSQLQLAADKLGEYYVFSEFKPYIRAFLNKIAEILSTQATDVILEEHNEGKNHSGIRIKNWFFYTSQINADSILDKEFLQRLLKSKIRQSDVFFIRVPRYKNLEYILTEFTKEHPDMLTQEQINQIRTYSELEQAKQQGEDKESDNTAQ